MRSKEWLLEAENNMRVKRQLDLLSNTDIDIVLGLLNNVNEQDEPYDPRAKFRKKNKFVDAPTVFNTAKPNISPVSPNISSTKSKSNDIESIIKNLSEKDKQLLAATLQKEKEQRVQQKRKRSSAKQPVTKTSTEPKKSSGMLGKIVLGILLGVGAASYFSNEPQTNTVDKVTVEKNKGPSIELLQKQYDVQLKKSLGSTKIQSIIPKNDVVSLVGSNGKNLFYALKNNNTSTGYELRVANDATIRDFTGSPVDFVSIQDYDWWKAGFDNIMEADFTIRNDNPHPIKDIEIECNHRAASGTKIDSNTRIIYDVIPAQQSKTFKNFNMGFIHSQAVTTYCKIISVK